MTRNRQKGVKIITSDMEEEMEQLSFNAPKSKNKSDNLETNIILATIFLIILAVCLYIFAIVSINSSNSNQLGNQANNKVVQKAITDLQKAKRTRYVKNEPEKKKNQQILDPVWIQKFKKLSTQISMQKLVRARQFFKNLSAPIDNKSYDQQKNSYIRDYEILKYSEKPMCIVIPTYNNNENERYKKNIDSILQQDYQNYRVIVIDDASSDGTSQAIYEHIKQHPVFKSGRIKLQKNSERKMALPNILDAARNYCQPEDIFMVIDGDDYLLGRYIFKLFNAAYSNSDSWIVYSNFLTVTDRVGYSRRYPLQIIQNRYFRKVLFTISHLRSFYTQLLLMIKPEDFLDETGGYFHAANDVSIFMPILEMGCDHITYLPEINYFYNANTGHNNHQQKKKQQIRNDKFVRMKPKYDKLNTLFPSKDVQLEHHGNRLEIKGDNY